VKPHGATVDNLIVDTVNFFSKVDVRGEDDCHPWVAGKTPKGYGHFYINRVAYRAHRLAYYIAYGPYPDHLGVLHLCDNTSCVNPKHLTLGTQAENMKDMSAKGRGANQIPHELAAEIAAKFRAGGFSLRSLGREYGLPHVTITRILNKGY